MVEAAGHDVGAAPHHRLQRLGAAREVDDLDVEAFVFEVAEAFSQGERKIEEPGLTADRNGHFRLLGRGVDNVRREQKPNSEQQSRREPSAPRKLCL